MRIYIAVCILVWQELCRDSEVVGVSLYVLIHVRTMKGIYLTHIVLLFYFRLGASLKYKYLRAVARNGDS